MGLYKTFRLTERLSVQFRGEHANLYADIGHADVSSATFMPAYFAGRRQIQLAAKIIF